MKKYYFLVMALAAIVSCTSDDFVGDQTLRESNENAAISFNLNVPTVTRNTVTGSDAASALNSQFIIWGEKNEINAEETGANVTTVPGASGREGHLVFQNYIVRWTDNSAYTTTSNTKNWEYVGYKFDDTSADPVTTNYSTNITPNTKGESVVDQTIKYWDFGASSYTFTAVSALPTDISGGKVKINKITSGENVYAKGYNIELKSDASLDKIFISDRNNITSTGAGTDRTAVNKYGGNVTMAFRNFMSKIRFGVYETIPGYKVKITKVYYNSTNSTTSFGVDGKFLVAGDNTAYTVSYYSDNKATVAVKSGTTPNNQSYFQTAPVSSGDVTVTVPILTADNIGTTATTATYNKSETVTATSTTDPKAYTTVLPFPTNNTSIKVKMDLRLISEDTNEIIDMTEATAEIPAAYCQWLPNYAYTYILKINDNTDGHMGSFVGLYPITFDAVEITDENGKAEYITTVSEPSITTFGVSGGKYVTGGNEYAAGSDIYATFTEGSTVKTPTLGDTGAQHVNIFKVTAADPTLITEASVAEAIANPAMSVDIYTRSGEAGSYVYTKVTDATTITAGTAYYKTDGSKAPGDEGYSETAAVAGTDYKVGATINVTDVTSDSSTNFSAAPAKVTTVPAEDGTTKTIDALKLTGVKAGTYAIEYEASAAWTGSYKKVYKVIVVQ